MQSSSPEPASPAAALADDAAYYRRVLHGIIDSGVNMIRAVEQQATAPVAPEPMAEAAVAFERLARTVRRCIAQARSLDEPVKPRSERVANARQAARARIRREVEGAIECGAEEAEAPELRERLIDRLESPDLDDAIDNRPIEEIIDALCRDLGLLGLAKVMRAHAAEPGARERRGRPKPLRLWTDEELAACDPEADGADGAQPGTRWHGD